MTDLQPPAGEDIHYALMKRSVTEDRVELVLSLFRAAECLSRTSIAIVGRADAALVLGRCVSRLEQLGVPPIRDCGPVTRAA